MKAFLLTFLLIFILYSCEKVSTSQMPDIPPNDSIDIDNDTRFDFVIEYSILATSGVPSTVKIITGDIRPLNDNQVLFHTSKGYLFLAINDTIKKEDNISSTWSDYSASVIGINGVNDKWGKDWYIISDLYSDYFLGIKLKLNDSEKIGWMQLNLDTKSGKIIIIDNKITASDELIIQK